MTTVGQRIKNFRKNCDISQSELAGKIGVSVQTVSKWECDAGMPDIIQIIPLSQVLGVTTDAILGADVNEQGVIDGIINSFREKWKNNPASGSLDFYFDMFLAEKNILKRFPMNYLVALECVRRGRTILERTVQDHIPAPEGCNVADVYRDIKRTARSVISYDTDLGRIAEAKMELIQCHFIMGNNEEAEAEFEGLPQKTEYDTSLWSAIVIGDRSMHIDAARKKFSYALQNLNSGFYHLANAYSLCGKEKRSEAKEICIKAIEIYECLEGFMGETERLDFLRRIWILLGKQYLRDGEFEKVIDCAEHLTMLCEKHFENEKQGNGYGKYFDSSVIKIGTELFKGSEEYIWDLTALYDECDNREGNPVVTSPKFKACVERIEKLK